MSLCNYEILIGRIRAATPESPICVFKSNDPHRLEAFFFTVRSRQMIDADRENFIGSFDMTTPIAEVSKALLAEISKNDPNARSRSRKSDVLDGIINRFNNTLPKEEKQQ